MVDAESAAVQLWPSSYQAYTEEAYRAMLARAGFTRVSMLDGLGGARPQEGFVVIIASQ